MTANVPSTPQDRIDHAKAIRASAIRRKNMRALALRLADEYGLRLMSVTEDEFTLRRRES